MSYLTKLITEFRKGLNAPNVEKARRYMCQLLDRGAEYGDAEGRAALKFNVDIVALRRYIGAYHENKN